VRAFFSDLAHLREYQFQRNELIMTAPTLTTYTYNDNEYQVTLPFIDIATAGELVQVSDNPEGSFTDVRAYKFRPSNTSGEAVNRTLAIKHGKKAKAKHGDVPNTTVTHLRLAMTDYARYTDQIGVDREMPIVIKLDIEVGDASYVQRGAAVQQTLLRLISMLLATEGQMNPLGFSPAVLDAMLDGFVDVSGHVAIKHTT